MVFLFKKYSYLCDMKNDDINILIEKSEKKVSLLKELKESINYESKIYDLIEFKHLYNKKYVLYRILDKKEMKSGDVNIIKSYIKMRNIDTNSIYNYRNALN